MTKWSLRTDLARWFAALMIAGGLAACADVQPLEYTEVHEIPPGPGLISGEAGEFELYRRDSGESAE